MTNSDLLEAFADALEAAARSLRRRAQLSNTEPKGEGGEGDVVERARAMHPQLGPRQAEVLRVLEDYGATGTNTGVISQVIDYEQANVYLTLQALISLGFVERDTATSPHIYRLSSSLGPKGLNAA